MIIFLTNVRYLYFEIRMDSLIHMLFGNSWKVLYLFVLAIGTSEMIFLSVLVYMIYLMVWDSKLLQLCFLFHFDRSVKIRSFSNINISRWKKISPLIPLQTADS